MSTATADADGNYLSTPTLDAESSDLLQTIASHGGYAYVRMSTLAASGDFRAAETARDMAWEQLHSGPWHSVLPAWRDAYSMACLHVAKFHYRNGEFKEALRVLDLGLIMGGVLLKKDLESAVETVTAKSREKESEGFEKGPKCKFVEEGVAFDKEEVARVLPEKSLSSKIVVKKSGLSLEGFLREHFLSGSPVIISDCMAHWPARKKWNDMDYLKRVAGDRTVPVEVGKNYLCQEWKQELITFSEFLEKIQSNDCSSAVPTYLAQHQLFDQVGKNYLCQEWKQELITFSEFLEKIHSNDCSSAVPTYLAQHQLFDQINELRKDVCIPDYCCAGGGDLRSLNAWFGPSGTVTPLHHDPHHNILAQVVGKKYVRLYASSVSEELYPYNETMLCNSSQVNLDNMDDGQFPKVHDLEFLDCILEEGEMLYIPPKWWHYVRSLTISFSVSFWWSDSESSDAS